MPRKFNSCMCHTTVIIVKDLATFWGEVACKVYNFFFQYLKLRYTLWKISMLFSYITVFRPRFCDIKCS